MSTIYKCCKRGKDVNRTPYVVYEAPTEKEALIYLSKNGGGVYKNTLHNFQFDVQPDEYKGVYYE